MNTVPISVSTGHEKVQLRVRRLQRACNKKIVLVDWVAHKAGMQCSVRSSSLATVPYSMKNLIVCFQDVFFLRNRNLLDYFVTVQCKKNANFSALNFIVLNLIYHGLTSA